MGRKQGRNTAVGIGFEVTPGTAVAATRIARLVDYNMTPTITSEDIGDLHLGDTGFPEADFHSTSRFAFEHVFYAYYQGGSLTSILRSLIGGTWVTTGASAPYTHTLTPGAEPPSMTYRYDRDFDVATGALTGGGILAGARTRTVTLEFALNGLVRITQRGSAMSWTTGSTPSLTVPARTSPVRTAEAGSLTWNSVGYTLRNLNVEVDNGLLEVEEFGSESAAAIVVNDPRSAQLSATRYKTNDEWVDGHIGRTESTANISFTSGTNVFRIDLGSSKIRQAVAHQSTTVGLEEETAVFVARDDGTNAPIKFTVTNDDSSAEAS